MNQTLKNMIIYGLAFFLFFPTLVIIMGGGYSFITWDITQLLSPQVKWGLLLRMSALIGIGGMIIGLFKDGEE